MNKQRIKYEQLTTGFKFSPSTFTIDVKTVSQYLKATEDGNALIYGDMLVPPMAVTALAMAAMAEKFELLPGTLHVSQQLEFSRTVAVNSTLTSYVGVNRVVARGKFHMLNLGIRVEDEDKETVVSGEIGFILPLS